MSTVGLGHKLIATWHGSEYNVEFKKIKGEGKEVQVIAEQVFAGSLARQSCLVDSSYQGIVAGQFDGSPRKKIRWLVNNGYIPRIQDGIVFFGEKTEEPQAESSSNQSCHSSSNTIRTILERNSLKVASENIFNRPLRNILEVIVNGLDACVTQYPTGKFGMGIRSLYGLIDFKETHGCKILFETAYEKEDGSLRAYGFKFCKAHGEYCVRRKTIAKEEKGTVVRITPKMDFFSQDTLKEILIDCYALQFYEYGSIEIHHGSKIIKIGKGESSLVTVWLSPQEIKIEDRGSGITEDVYEKIICSSPGTSKKQLNTAKVIASCEFSETVFEGRKIPSTPSFLLLINGIVILDFPIPYVKKDFLVYLPSTVTLTLARDAVTLDYHLEECLQKLINTTIQDVVNGADDPLLLAALHAGLRGLKFFSLALYLEKILAEQIATSKKVVFPLEEIDELRPILTHYCKSLDCLPLPSPLSLPFISAFQTMIIHSMPKVDHSLFKGKTVIFVEDHFLSERDVASYNLPGLLFARNSFLESTEDLAWRLYSHYAEDGRSLYLNTDPSHFRCSSQFLIWKGARPTVHQFDCKATDISLTHQLVQNEGILQDCPDELFEGFFKIAIEEENLIPNISYSSKTEPYAHMLEIDNHFVHRRTILLREIKAAIEASFPVIIRIKDGLYIFPGKISDEVLQALEREADKRVNAHKSRINNAISGSEEESSESQEEWKVELQKKLRRQDVQEEQFDEFVKVNCRQISFGQAGKLLLNYLLLLANIKEGDVIQFADQSPLWPGLVG